MNLSPGSDQEPGFSVISYSADVEAEVDGIYKQMYDEQITIDGVIALLQRTKESSNPHDHEIFSCMLHFLFEEYKFFQNCYPPRELAMTGYLFGSLIQHQLVDYIPLGIAIRYVLDALQCPPETNLFKFGIQALSRFEARLPELRPLCQALIDIPHLAEARPDIAESIRRALAAAPSDAVPGVLPLQGFALTTTSEVQHVFTAIRPDFLDEDSSESPSEEVSDKILFIVNNLAPSNFDSKLMEMKDRFKDVYSRWFAIYLVEQRVSTEPNNHQLYLRLLDGLDSPSLAKFILHETITKSASLLNSEKTKQSSIERTVLKNLGSWLGQITFARDKPIKQKNISFKELLLEGADNDCLLIAIPFVCKVLEACGKSRVFKPPNPWLTGVMSLLAELYHFADLKLQLKFEIEVLCGALDVQMDQIDIANIYRGRPPLEPSVGPDLPEYPADIDSLPIGGYDHVAAEAQVLPIPPASPAEAQRAVGSHIESILATLAGTIKINAQFAPLNTNQSFKRAIQLAIDRSVREVSLVMFDRSALTNR
jgi:CCR4-NOT transcription complex subunit 1